LVAKKVRILAVDSTIGAGSGQWTVDSANKNTTKPRGIYINQKSRGKKYINNRM